MCFPEFGSYIINFLRKYIFTKPFWERWILNSDSHSCEIGFGFHYDTQSETHESKKYSFQIQDRPHRALYYILPSLIAAVIFNIPRYSEPVIFQQEHSCWRFENDASPNRTDVTLQHKLWISQISTIFSATTTFRFFDTELKIKCLDFEACNCGKMVRCVGRVEKRSNFLPIDWIAIIIGLYF